MKRSEFLRKLGIGLGVAVVAPQILANAPKEEEIKPLVGKPLLKSIAYDGHTEVRTYSTNITPSKEFMDVFAEPDYFKAMLEADYQLQKRINEEIIYYFRNPNPIKY